MYRMMRSSLSYDDESSKETSPLTANSKEIATASPRPAASSGNKDRSSRAPIPPASPHGILKGMIVKELCNVGDMKDGEVREFEVDGTKILLIKEFEEFHAIGAICTHSGAPLVKGAYCSGRLRCPWHGACFDVATGDLEDFPGLDSLPKYATKIENDKVVFVDNVHHLRKPRRTKKMARQDQYLSGKGSSVLIVGGGAAALSCAETLRQEGFSGQITMLSQEPLLPYDRTVLSKDPDASLDIILLRSQEFYHEHCINVVLNSRTVKVDLSGTKITVETETGALYHGKILVLATGGRPRTLGVPGELLENIFTLRSPMDSQRIAATSTGKNVVIMGSYFIGMEMAAALSRKSRSVTVVAQSKVPFRNAFDQPVGKSIRNYFEENGVRFIMECGVAEFRGDAGKLTEVLLTDGTKLPADVCVVGVGILPNTEFLRKSGIVMNPDGFVLCNEKMETNQRHVYACGDIVVFPLQEIFAKQKANIQHWSVAMKQGQIAARNIAGKPTSINVVPFFWSSFFGHSIRYTGYAQGYDKLIVHGNIDQLKFVAYFLRDRKLVAVATMSSDPTAAQVAEALHMGLTLTEEDVVQNEENDWSYLLKVIQ